MFADNTGLTVNQIRNVLKNALVSLGFNSDAIKALDSIWCIGDRFLDQIHHTMDTLRTSTIAQQGKKMYLHQHFNVHMSYLSSLNPTKTVIARIHNSLVSLMNQEGHLPQYIIIIPDKDIISSINYFDFGIRDLIEKNLNWLIRIIFRTVLSRREALKKTRPGAAPASLPTIIWVNMLTRPLTTNPDLKRLWSQCHKFNSTLDNILTIEKYMKIINLPNFTEHRYFDILGKLTMSGEYHFWRALDDMMHDIDSKGKNAPWVQQHFLPIRTESTSASNPIEHIFNSSQRTSFIPENFDVLQRILISVIQWM